VSAAERAPRALFVAIERVAEAQITAMERAAAAGIGNVRFITCDARRMPDFFAEGEVGRIYINFCDPWPGAGHSKRRLTSVGFLELYGRVLRPGGDICFKTDDVPLFEFSLFQFEKCGFEIAELPRDLYAEIPFEAFPEPTTDYEVKFHGQGRKICRLRAVLAAEDGVFCGGGRL
jgi:tRNA (guanine-N7-)-methyltransferase